MKSFVGGLLTGLGIGGVVGSVSTGLFIRHHIKKEVEQRVEEELQKYADEYNEIRKRYQEDTEWLDSLKNEEPPKEKDDAKSGRYPWGSGESPYQHEDIFSEEYEEVDDSSIALIDAEDFSTGYFGVNLTYYRNDVLLNEITGEFWKEDELQQHFGVSTFKDLRNLRNEQQEDKRGDDYNTIYIRNADLATDYEICFVDEDFDLDAFAAENWDPYDVNE